MAVAAAADAFLSQTLKVAYTTARKGRGARARGGGPLFVALFQEESRRIGIGDLE